MANCSPLRTAQQPQAANSYTPTVEFDRLMAEGLSVDVAVGQLEAAGWVIDEVREDHTPMRFSDIAALISYVRTAPWAFEDLDWHSAKPALQRLHAQSLSRPIDAVSHSFLVLATR
ncbi:MAG: hypothetical protein K0R13_3191 [Propionibacteriaceae bacterium]|jgi:hypothetical protein|nr:hypothetical protein [Propionibacteriaceae bacterium]